MILLKKEYEKFYDRLIYSLQLPKKLNRQLQKTYETKSTEEWELLKHTYEEEPVGCDYKNCPRSNPKNGIKEVFLVRDKKTSELFRFGSDCYFKLIYGKEELNEKEKKEREIFLRNIKKQKAEYSTSIQESKQYLREQYHLVKIKLDKLEIPFFLEPLVIAEEKFKQANSVKELEHLVKHLDTYYFKYFLELENIKYIWETYYDNSILKYHIKETGEKTVMYELYDIVEMKKTHACKSNRWEIIRMGADIKIKCINCGRIVMMTRRNFNKNLVRVIARFLVEVTKSGHIIIMTRRKSDKKLVKNIAECLIKLSVLAK